MPVSNASLLDLDCSDLTGWSDNDTGEAASIQATFDSKSTFKFDTNTSADTNDRAIRIKDVGSVDGLGNRIVASVKLYCDLVGAIGDTDYCQFGFNRSDWHFRAAFASDGLFIYTGAAWQEVGINLVVQDIWQEWTFDIDISGGVASAVCDVYLDSVLKASGVDCIDVGARTDGNVELALLGHATDDLVAYMDWIKIGDGFDFMPRIMMF